MGTLLALPLAFVVGEKFILKHLEFFTYADVRPLFQFIQPRLELIDLRLEFSHLPLGVRTITASLCLHLFAEQAKVGANPVADPFHRTPHRLFQFVHLTVRFLDLAEPIIQFGLIVGKALFKRRKNLLLQLLFVPIDARCKGIGKFLNLRLKPQCLLRIVFLILQDS